MISGEESKLCNFATFLLLPLRFKYSPQYILAQDGVKYEFLMTVIKRLAPLPDIGLIY
jgi:hypothetical protein